MLIQRPGAQNRPDNPRNTEYEKDRNRLRFSHTGDRRENRADIGVNRKLTENDHQCQQIQLYQSRPAEKIRKALERTGPVAFANGQHKVNHKPDHSRSQTDDKERALPPDNLSESGTQRYAHNCRDNRAAHDHRQPERLPSKGRHARRERRHNRPKDGVRYSHANSRTHQLLKGIGP